MIFIDSKIGNNYYLSGVYEKKSVLRSGAWMEYMDIVRKSFEEPEQNNFPAPKYLLRNPTTIESGP